MELEGSYFDDETNTNNPQQASAITGSATLQIDHWDRRIRNFNLAPPTVLYRYELPERSQSSLSHVNDKQLVCAITNRLEAQHGIVRPRKLSREEDTETLVEVVKKRRSRSADYRFGQNWPMLREVADRTKLPSTSRESRQRAGNCPQTSPDIKIQINGEGVEI